MMCPDHPDIVAAMDAGYGRCQDAVQQAYHNGYQDGWVSAIRAVLQELDARLGNGGAGAKTEEKDQ